MYDVVIIGGGPAGLQAALALGRLHRSCLVLDSGIYRNAAASHMHNFLTHDHRVPGEFLGAARQDLTRYSTVQLREETAEEIIPSEPGFTVTTSNGDRHEARRVILATGVRDLLPPVPGMGELWGTVVAHCPFCHGHEYSDGTVAIQGGPHAPRLAAMLAPIAGQLMVLANGYELSGSELDQLARIGAEVRRGGLVALHRDGTGAKVELDDGTSVFVDGFFVAGALEQAAPFAEALGLSMLPSGCIEVDGFGRTSSAGVFAAGDLAHQAAYPMPLASVLNAAAAGGLAAVAVLQELITEDYDLPPMG